MRWIAATPSMATGPRSGATRPRAPRVHRGKAGGRPQSLVDVGRTMEGMGIFQSRPEEPSEWAGLPAEPWEPRVAGEVLAPAPHDPADLGVLTPPDPGAPATRVVVPLEPAPTDTPERSD